MVFLDVHDRSTDHVLLIPWLCAWPSRRQKWSALAHDSDQVIMAHDQSQKMTEISNLAVPVLFGVSVHRHTYRYPGKCPYDPYKEVEIGQNQGLFILKNY